MSSTRIRSEVFLREDIQSILRAIDFANAELARHLPDPEIAIYRAGFQAALSSVARAFHVDLDDQHLGQATARSWTISEPSSAHLLPVPLRNGSQRR